MYFLYSWLDQVIAIKEDIISYSRLAQHQLSIMTELAITLKVDSSAGGWAADPGDSLSAGAGEIIWH